MKLGFVNPSNSQRVRFVQYILQLHQPIFREVPTRARAPAIYPGGGAAPPERSMWSYTPCGSRPGAEDVPERLYLGESATCVRRRCAPAPLG